MRSPVTCPQCGCDLLQKAALGVLRRCPECAAALYQCARCGGELEQLGGHCHHCGAPAGLADDLLEPFETRAYCMKDKGAAGALRGAYPYCPRCGTPLHLHVLAQRATIVPGRQRHLAVRLCNPGPAPATVLQLDALLEGDDRAPEERLPTAVKSAFEIAPGAAFDLKVSVKAPPCEAVAGDHQGEKRVLRLQVEYAAAGEWHALGGDHEVDVAPHRALGHTTVSVGHTNAGASDDAYSYQGMVHATVNLPGETPPTPLDEEELVFGPVQMLRMSRPLPEPADAARLYYRYGPKTHNFCLLTAHAVRFGRHQSRKERPERRRVIEEKAQREGRRIAFWSDVHFIEWEQQAATREPLKGRDKLKNASCISRKQWLVSPGERGAVVEQLGGGSPVNAAGSPLETGASRELAVGQCIEITDSDYRRPVLGLRVAAAAPAFEELEAWRAAARACLAEALDPPPRQPLWKGPYGGYRLDRLHSLTGERVEVYSPRRKACVKSEDHGLRESYVLTPGWCSIGPGNSAVIPLPETPRGDKTPWAHLLWVDGYFFIVLARADAPVSVVLEGRRIAPEIGKPLLLSFGARIHLGETTLDFDAFEQLDAPG